MCVPLWFIPPAFISRLKGLAFTRKKLVNWSRSRQTCQLSPPPSFLPPSFVSRSSPVSLSAPRRNFAKMMQEVSITVAYDAHVINQINEEDFYASLVANSKPKPVVSLTQMAFYCFFFLKIIWQQECHLVLLYKPFSCRADTVSGFPLGEKCPVMKLQGCTIFPIIFLFQGMPTCS